MKKNMSISFYNLTDMFLTSLTLLPQILFIILAIPVIKSLYFLSPFFEETSDLT